MMEAIVLLAGAGLSDAGARGDLWDPMLRDVLLFFALPCITGLMCYLILQRIMEFMLHPRITLAQLLLLIVYASCAIASLDAWLRFRGM